MRLSQNLPTPRILVYFTLIIVVLGCIPMIIYARQFVQPLSLEELEQKALAAAQTLGLQSEPKTQTSIQTTLEKWYSLNDSGIERSIDRDAPVFIMSLQGEVVLYGRAEARYDSLTVAIDAITGQLVGHTTQYFALDAIDLAALPTPEIYIFTPIPPPPYVLTAGAMPYPGKPTPDHNYTPVP
jgi:hypothetical protein